MQSEGSPVSRNYPPPVRMRPSWLGALNIGRMLGDCWLMARATLEHSLQVMVKKAVRAHVPQPHFWFAIDRSKKSSAITHIREKARGLIAGLPDTMLIYPGKPLIAIELKASGKKVTEGGNQDRVGAAIEAAGALWSWCDSVEGYMELLRHFGIPLDGNWELTAANYDALLESASIRREESKGVISPARRRPPKPTKAQLNALARARAGGALV